MQEGRNRRERCEIIQTETLKILVGILKHKGVLTVLDLDTCADSIPP